MSSLFSSNVLERPFGFLISWQKSKKTSSWFLHEFARRSLRFLDAWALLECRRLLLGFGIHDWLCAHKKKKKWAKCEGGYLNINNNNNKDHKTPAYLCCQWCWEHQEATTTTKGGFFNELIHFAWGWRVLRPFFGNFKKTHITYSKIGLFALDCLRLNVWNLRYTDMKSCRQTNK